MPQFISKPLGRMMELILSQPESGLMVVVGWQLALMVWKSFSIYLGVWG
jgi:hypothetical protein